MNPLEQELEYPWGDSHPDAGCTIAIADGVRWIRMPLPFALDHINLWLLRDRIDGREGWTVVDCGIDRQEVRDSWESVFVEALDGLPVLRVLVTHMHPDHVGLAHWLCARWQAPLWMTMSDYALARLWAGFAPQGVGLEGAGSGSAGSEGARSEGARSEGARSEGAGPAGDAAVRHFARHGLLDADAHAQIRARHDYYTRLVPDMPRRFHRLMHGQDLQIGGRDWRVMVGYGHAPEHASLWSPALDVLIAGDMVLPRISTNISVFDLEPEANPLPLYLESLRAYDSLPVEALVLPSHGRPFRGLHRRIAQQQAHHAERLAEVLAACAQPRSAHDLLPLLFRRKLDMHQLSFAMGEAIAHLHALYFEGSLRRTLGDDGVYRFQRS